MSPAADQVRTTLDAFGIDHSSVSTIVESAERADRIRVQGRQWLADHLGPGLETSISIVATGSLGRGEVTANSDLDAFAIATQTLDDHQDAVRAIENAISGVQEDLPLRKPGATGLFGGIVSGFDLVHRVGLEEDTNSQQTRRLLLLMESTALYSEDVHKSVLAQIVDRYLDEHDPGDGKLPRFLVNDVMRYWRTLAVDYQAKRWQLDQTKWAARHLKFVSTRKTLVASTVASIISADAANPRQDILASMQEPPIVRLARLATAGRPSGEAFKTVVRCVEEFLGALGDEEYMELLRTMSIEAARHEPRFAELVNRTAHDLHDGLIEIIHESDTARSKKYLLF